MENYSYENIGGGITVAVSKQHTFGTDSFLLSHFATPKKKDIACDLGTGCGIIPLLWQRSKETTPKETWAVDIQPQAVEQMLITAGKSKLINFNPLLADLKDIEGQLPCGAFDLVTCNPPYKTVGSGIISESDSDKVARHETMANFNDICIAAKRLLRFGGRFCICQLPERLVDVITAMRKNGLEPKRIRTVQNDSTSAPWLILVEGKRGSQPFLTLDPPLIMREGGKSTDEMDKIYGMYGKV